MQFKKKAKYVFELVKYQFDMGRSGRLVQLGFGQQVTGFNIDNVVLSNDMLVVSGFLPELPAAVAHKNGFVYVNDAFMNLSYDIQCAIVAHERGHLELGHMRKSAAKLIARNIGRVFGSHEAVRCEFEADLYSQDSGYDMVKALTFIKEELAWILGDSGIAEIDQRLQNLKSNC
jgi:hypothetical protein